MLLSAFLFVRALRLTSSFGTKQIAKASETLKHLNDMEMDMRQSNLRMLDSITDVRSPA
jgi:hypothetical protein